MSPKLKQALSLLVSTTIVLAQPMTVMAESTNEVNNEITNQIMPEVNEDTTNEIASEVDEDTTNEISSEVDEDTTNELMPEYSFTDSYAELTDEEVIPYAAAVNPRVVYTQSTKSNLDRSGNGTSSNPYNRFEDAVANVEDGGTIIIKNGLSGFLNTQDEAGLVPFIIDKDITIRSESDSDIASLIVRSAGIILEGNVTFKNVEFSFANKVHDSIFANGYTLELIDCIRSSGTRQIDLFAGSLYEKDGSNLIQGHVYDISGDPSLVTPVVGNSGEIIIQTTSKLINSEFGKVFAGSMNGRSNADAAITIKNEGYLDLVGIYGCGAEEADPGHIFDLTEPAPPKEQPTRYIVDGIVDISLNNYVTDISGSGSRETHVAMSTYYPRHYFNLNAINSLTIDHGTIIPNVITWQGSNAGDITLNHPNATLDLSQINQLTVHDFNGGGKITLQKDGMLTVNNLITGQTLFQTVGASVDSSSSGPVLVGHPYITSTLDHAADAFTFNPPVFFKSRYKLVKNDLSWQIEEDLDADSLPETLTDLAFTDSQINLVYKTNGYISYPDASFSVTNEDGSLDDLTVLNLPFTLSLSGKPLTMLPEPNSGWQHEALNLDFYFSTDSNGPVLAVAAIDDTKPIHSGTYELTLALPDYNLSSNITLSIVSDADTGTLPSQDEQVDFTVDHGGVTVSEAAMGESITLAITTEKLLPYTSLLTTYNQIEVFVNNQFVKGVPVTGATTLVTIPVNAASGFKTGSNKIKILYGGTEVSMGSTSEMNFTVHKATPNLSLSSDLVTTYNGKNHSLKASVSNIVDAVPTIYYYTDEACTKGQTTVAPIHPGTYYMQATLPETDSHFAATATGKIEIQKATPDLVISGTVINHNDQTNSLKVDAKVNTPLSAHTPVGQILLTCTDETGNSQTASVPLKSDTISHSFDHLTDGKYTVTASYLPEVIIDGNTYTDVNYNAVNNIEEEFDVINNFIPVTDVTLLATELQLHELHSDITLPFTITPDDASTQDVTWESSDPNVVSIDSKTGKLRFNQGGQAIITIRTKDGNFSQSCQITVVSKDEQLIPVEAISLNETTLTLDLNSTNEYELVPTITPLTASSKDVIWRSLDDSIAHVTDAGVVIAKGTGRTKVVAITKDGAKMATCDIQVTNSTETFVPVTSVSLLYTQLDLEIGQRKNLSPTIEPTIATDQGLAWTSSDSSIVEVTENGTVIAKSTGTATIQATTLDGSNLTATCVVTIKAPNNTEDDSNKPGGGDTEGDNNKPGDGDTEDDNNKPGSGNEGDNNKPGSGNEGDSNKPGSGDNVGDSNKPGNNNPGNNNSGNSGGGSTDDDDDDDETDNNTSGSNPPSNNTPENVKPEQDNKPESDSEVDDSVTLPTSPNPTISQFKDLETHWAKEDIAFVLDKGLFKGISSTEFGAHVTTTRGMFVTILHRLADAPTTAPSNFLDVASNKYYAEAVAWANQMGVASGVSTTNFAPEQNITREQLITMLYQYAQITNVQLTTTSTNLNTFQDAHHVANWSKEAMQWAVSTGLLKGNTTNRISPKHHATRAEVACIMKRFLEKVQM